MNDVALPPNYRPTEREPFMSPRQREYFRRRLSDWKDDILKEAQETIIHLQTNNTPEPDIAVAKLLGFW